ncbi:carboxypeptidase-like regulatory domain-containing protein [Winogradskyella algicola]|uniref:carboxypeptidase-like regulatory domain-containing protein n=1 Tax=Winogradskyella algicola TaxID=2575815 RepID=UPI001108E6B1|nr:carboxypeptidase-like regulatory domain-containing protein [Winogradskyella algicola]
MKTQTVTQNKTFKTFGFALILMMSLFTFNTAFSQTTEVTQERTIKGLVSNEDGPLPGANITLDGTIVGAVTDDEGKFTFPKKLKTGDVLVFSYLGYETQKVSITDKTSFITLELTPDMVEMIGAIDTNKPYKSKRKKN